MKKEESYSAAETARRREAALKRMLSTPHKPHAKPAKKRAPSRAKSASRKRAKKA